MITSDKVEQETLFYFIVPFRANESWCSQNPFLQGLNPSSPPRDASLPSLGPTEASWRPGQAGFLTACSLISLV